MNIRLLDWQMEIVPVHLYSHRINTKYWQVRQEYPTCQLCLPTAASELTVQSVVWSKWSVDPGVTSVMKYDIYHRGKCGPTSRSVSGRYDDLEQHAEGEGEGDDHQQPGDAEQEPAQEAEARVAALLHGAR